MNKTNQDDYIEYLEQRIKKLSKNAKVKNQDLDTLIDVQNEILFNDLASKRPLKTNSSKQIKQLQKRILISDGYINYLMNSYWWKMTYPTRLFVRHFKKHLSYHPFDFSKNDTIKDDVEVLIYAENANNDLVELISSLRKQKNLKSLHITIVDLIGSENISKIAKNNNSRYINMLILDEDTLMSKTLLRKQTKYAVYIDQDLSVNDSEWLYKMIYPLKNEYASMSVLYDERVPYIRSIEKGTFFKELKTRVIKIDNYKCLFLPTNRDSIQYIPITITEQSSAIAKKVK